MFLRIIPMGLGLLTYLAQLVAHDLYIMPESFRPKTGESLRVELHNGDSFPESEGPPAKERLTGTRLLSSGSSVDLKRFREEHKALVTDVSISDSMVGTLYLTASLSANSRDYDGRKFEAYLEDEGLAMVKKYRQDHGEQDKPVKELYSKYAKTLLVNGTPSNFSTKPLGLKLEIVPTIDPGTLKPGESMPVQVLLDGKPASGVTLETAWTTGAPAKASVVGKTDTEGRILVPLQSGKCRITTGWSQRYPDQSKANWETFFATFTFELTGQ